MGKCPELIPSFLTGWGDGGVIGIGKVKVKVKVQVQVQVKVIGIGKVKVQVQVKVIGIVKGQVQVQGATWGVRAHSRPTTSRDAKAGSNPNR
jgi:hypothetical protein